MKRKLTNENGELERRLEDAHYHRTVRKPKKHLDQQLPIGSLSAMSMTPVVPPSAALTTKHRKRDHERRVQYDSVENEFERKLENLNFCSRAADHNGNRRDWDVQPRRFEQDMPVNGSIGIKNQFKTPHMLPPLNIAHLEASGRQARNLESKLYESEDQCELKLQILSSGAPRHKVELEQIPKTSRQVQHGFKINEYLIYALLFFSTAAFHCVIFFFNVKLRQLLRIDAYPIGILLLLSWTFVGFIHFIGGILGDFVRDRVVFLRRAVVLWGFAILIIHIAVFNLSPAITSISLVSGLVCASIAYGIVCPNMIALGVESIRQALIIPLPSDKHVSSSEEDSSAESEASIMSDISMATTDLNRRYNCVSHTFFAGCFAARLAASTLVQGYYFLSASLDTLPGENSRTISPLRGYCCMLFVSIGLMTSVICFCVQSWHYRRDESASCNSSSVQRLERKLVNFERDLNASVKPLWTNVLRICNRTPMPVVGTGLSFVLVLTLSQTSLTVRLVAFLFIMFGWLLSMISTSRQLNPKQKKFLKTRCLQFLPSVSSYSPVTRMCVAMLLYLVSVFLSSLVELYRRKAPTSPSLLPRSCGTLHSDFTFLWTLPYVVLLSASDTLFHVSLQEACRDLPPRDWTGTMQGTISLAETLGYATALSLVAVLSRWLFQPKPKDMALFFLLVTTAVALTHLVLNRIAARAQAHQSLFSLAK